MRACLSSLVKRRGAGLALGHLQRVQDAPPSPSSSRGCRPNETMYTWPGQIRGNHYAFRSLEDARTHCLRSNAARCGTRQLPPARQPPRSPGWPLPALQHRLPSCTFAEIFACTSCRFRQGFRPGSPWALKPFWSSSSGLVSCSAGARRSMLPYCLGFLRFVGFYGCTTPLPRRSVVQPRGAESTRLVNPCHDNCANKYTFK